MRLSFLRSTLAACLALASAGLLVSCTSSGDGGTGATDDFLNQGATLVAEPSDAPTLPEYVSFVETSGDRDSSCIAVRATRAFDVFAAAFTVSYDPAMLRFTSFDSAATCLGSGSNVLPTQVDSSTPGVLVVGLSRNAAATSTGVACGDIIQICFDVIGEGDTRMRFTGNTRLIDPAGAEIVVDWVDTTVQTRL